MTTSINPLLLDLPVPIRTPRLVLSPAHPDHAEAFYNAQIASMPHLRPWMLWADDVITLDSTHMFLRRKYAAFTLREDITLLAFTHDGEFVAATGLHDLNWHIPMADIGYWCHIDQTGHGYMTEIANGLLHYGFAVLGLRKISICMDSENARSENVAKRLGMSLEYEQRGGLRTLHEGDALRVRRVYSVFSRDDVPPLDVSWS